MTDTDMPDRIDDASLIARVEQLIKAITGTGEFVGVPWSSRVDEFCMRIPADPKRDADIVLSELLKRYKAKHSWHYIADDGLPEDDTVLYDVAIKWDDGSTQVETRVALGSVAALSRKYYAYRVHVQDVAPPVRPE